MSEKGQVFGYETGVRNNSQIGHTGVVYCKHSAGSKVLQMLQSAV